VMLAQFAHVSASSKVLIVGDIIGEYAQQALASSCGGCTVVNKAVGGTTAVQWGTSATDDTNFATAWTDGGGDFTHVWISQLGNDFITNASCDASDACTMSQSARSGLMSNIIAKVKAVSSTVKIVLTGYCQTSSRPTDAPACSPGAMNTLALAIQDAVAAASATYVDISCVCGGSSSTYSNKIFFRDSGEDPLHLNNNSYCKVWTLNSLQSAFSCTGTPATCANPGVGGSPTTICTLGPPPPPSSTETGGAVGSEATYIVTVVAALAIQAVYMGSDATYIVAVMVHWLSKLFICFTIVAYLPPILWEA